MCNNLRVDGTPSPIVRRLGAFVCWKTGRVARNREYDSGGVLRSPRCGENDPYILRLSIAAILGGILGYEREQKGKSAGLRTHMLVALGAALFVFIPQQAGMSDADLSRVLQGFGNIPMPSSQPTRTTWADVRGCPPGTTGFWNTSAPHAATICAPERSGYWSRAVRRIICRVSQRRFCRLPALCDWCIFCKRFGFTSGRECADR